MRCRLLLYNLKWRNFGVSPKTFTRSAYNICSSYFDLHKELDFLKNILKNNGYPINFINTYIGQQLSKLYLAAPSKLSENIKRPVLYIPLTFTGQQSINIKKDISKLLCSTYPQIDIKIYFVLQNKIRNFFKVKDKIPTSLRSKLIYLWKCRSCDATYVGRSTRSAWTRWSEHLGRSFRTGNYLTRPSYSAIREHREGSSHPLSMEDFSVLTSCPSVSDLDILEAMYTYKLKPSIARNTPMASLLCF